MSNRANKSKIVKNLGKGIVKSAPQNLSLVKDLKSLKLGKLHFHLLPKNLMPRIKNAMMSAVISILNFNPENKITTNKNTCLKHIDIQKTKDIRTLQKYTFPLGQEYYRQLKNCPKYIVKSEELQVISRNGTPEEQTRLLLVGKLPSGNYATFILNFIFKKDGKLQTTNSHFGVLIDGKDFFQLERYDGDKDHMNLFYDANYNEVKFNSKKIIYKSHLHYHNERSLLTIYEGLIEEGYKPKEIIKSYIMQRQEAISYPNFETHEIAYNKLLERYKINDKPSNFKAEDFVTVGNFYESMNTPTVKTTATQSQQEKTQQSKEKPLIESATAKTTTTQSQQGKKRFFYDNSRDEI